MEYKNTEDFASDCSFIDWCLQSEYSDNKFWEDYIENHPEQIEVISEAKELVIDLYELEVEENAERINRETWKNIEEKINTNTKIIQLQRLKFSYAAAGVLLLFVFTVFALKIFLPGEQSIISSTEWINHENTSGLVETIVLADKSTVQLEPFSSLKYPTAFNKKQRRVFLQGEAFFDIQRDTLKPFMIYANETVTKVLGTSFRIIAFEGQKTVEVEVKTGKVAVYANVKSGTQEKQKKQMVIEADEKIVMPLPNKKLEVTPNQKVVFDSRIKKMTKSVMPVPMLIKQPMELEQYKFKNEEVSEVFKVLEKAYGIELVYDKEALSACRITTQLNDESLFQKLNIICAALNLQLSEKDARIFISGGAGC